MRYGTRLSIWRAMLLLISLSSQAATGTEYIRRFNAVGVLQTPVYTDPADLATAINACNSGDSLELRAGTDVPYTFPHDVTFDLGERDLTITSTGFTQRVTAIDVERDTLTIDGSVQFTHGQRVRFFGEGSPQCVDRVNYAVATWNSATRELQVASSEFANRPIDLIDDQLATRPLYVYFHAVIKPASHSQDYNQFIRLLDGSHLTLRNLTLTGEAPLAGGQGNTNREQNNRNHGRLLKLDSQSAQVTLEGVQVMDCVRGGDARTHDASFALWVVDCPRLSMTRCFTDNTDYHGCRVEDVDEARISECTFRNFRQRGLGQECTHETRRFLLERCYFYCTPDIEGSTGPTPELRTCINFDAREFVQEVAFRQSVFDLRDVEGAGFSWDFQNNATHFPGPQSCPMMKLQSIRRFEMSDCQVLHSGNKNTEGDTASPGPQCYSVKFDRTTTGDDKVHGVVDATFRRTTFSGALVGSPAMDNARTLTIAGCQIMQDGHFNSSFALDFMDYPIVQIVGDDSVVPSIPSTIKHLWDRTDQGYPPTDPAIIRYTLDWSNLGLGPERRFLISDTHVSALPGMSRNAWIFSRVRAASGPTHSDPFVEVRRDTCTFCQPDRRFCWGVDDPHFVIQNCPLDQ